MNQPGNQAIRTNWADLEGFFFRIIWTSCMDQVGRTQPGTNRANATNRATGYPTGNGFFLVASKNVRARNNHIQKEKTLNAS